MGYYIEVPENKNKTQQLINLHGAKEIGEIEALACIKAGNQGVVCIVDNGMFEAAAFVYNESEFDAFTDIHDLRPRKFVKMDLELAKKLASYI